MNTMCIYMCVYNAYIYKIYNIIVLHIVYGLKIGSGRSFDK